MQNASLTSTVSGLLDQELLAQTKSLVRREQQFTLLVIDCRVSRRSSGIRRVFSRSSAADAEVLMVA